MLPAVIMATALCMALPSCKSKPSDADIQTKVQTAIAATPGVSADVKDGVVTLSGLVGSEADKTAIETAVNGLKDVGVQSVVDNIEVEPAPPAPTVVGAASALSQAVADATKDFPGVTATVADSVITVTGELEQAKVIILKQVLDALNPKKTDMSQLKVK